MGPISTLPIGLPKMFGLTGQAVPKEVSDTITPTIDVNPYLVAANALEVISAPAANVAAAGLTSIPTLVVPEGEMWMVRGASIAWSTLGTEICRARLVAGRSLAAGPLAIQQLGNEDSASLTDVAASGVCRSLSLAPFLLGPGEFVGLHVSRFTSAGNIQIYGQAIILRIPL